MLMSEDVKVKGDIPWLKSRRPPSSIIGGANTTNCKLLLRFVAQQYWSAVCSNCFIFYLQHCSETVTKLTKRRRNLRPHSWHNLSAPPSFLRVLSCVSQQLSVTCIQVSIRRSTLITHSVAIGFTPPSVDVVGTYGLPCGACGLLCHDFGHFLGKVRLMGHLTLINNRDNHDNRSS